MIHTPDSLSPLYSRSCPLVCFSPATQAPAFGGQDAQSKRELLLADFDFEEEHNLDIAFLDTTSNLFVANNNDNFHYKSLRNPHHVLNGNHFRAEILLVAVHVNVTYSVEFEAVGSSSEARIIEEKIG